MIDSDFDMPRCRCCGRDWPAGLQACPIGGAVLDEDPTEIAFATAPPRDADGTDLLVLPAELPRGTTLGDYQLIGKVGEGAMGAVYQALQPVIGKHAAVKVLAPQLGGRPDVVERFVQEARALAKIGHPNIVDAYSFGMLPDGRCYFIMEWLKGETLGARLDRGRLPLADALDFLDQVCRGLAAAHEKGIIHRDLKPDNVFLVEVRGEKPRVKILDFSIAKLADEEDLYRPNRTQTGIMLGTPNYVSPEQAKGRGVDHRTDLYSLGVMAYQMVLGRLPFISDSSVEIVSMHLNQAPPRPSQTWADIPPPLERLILALLAKDPAERPTISEVRAVIESLKAVAAEGVPVRRRSSSAPVRRVFLFSAAITIFVAVGLALAWSLTRTPDATVRVSPRRPVAAPAPRPAGSIIVRVDVPDARVEIDGRVVAEAAETASLSVDRAGSHTVTVTAPGKRRFEKVVTVGDGAAVEVQVRMTAEDPQPDPMVDFDLPKGGHSTKKSRSKTP